MLRFSACTAVALVLFAGAAFGGAGTTTDSSSNARQPEAPLDAYSTAPSDYEVAKHLLRHRDYAEAIPHLQLALADKPKDPDLLSDLGYAKAMTGDQDGALYYYQRALTIDPNHTSTHQRLGELDLAKSDTASAQKELATLSTLCPSGCDDRSALSDAIAAYKPPATAGMSAAAPTTHQN